MKELADSFVNRLRAQRKYRHVGSGMSFVERYSGRTLTATSSYRQRLARKRSQLIYLIRGTDSTSRAAWYYFQANPLTRRLFEERVKQQTVQLLDYGTIIKSGYGDDPPQDVKEAMYRDYGFEE